MSAVSDVEGPHNHRADNDDKIMADIYRVLPRCQPVHCAFCKRAFLIFTTALLFGLTDEETDSERLRNAQVGI